VDGLGGSGLDRLLHAQGDDEQPDDPRREKDKVGGLLYDSQDCGL
jgi:hypothetical protein